MYLLQFYTLPLPVSNAIRNVDFIVLFSMLNSLQAGSFLMLLLSSADFLFKINQNKSGFFSKLNKKNLSEHSQSVKRSWSGSKGSWSESKRFAKVAAAKGRAKTSFIWTWLYTVWAHSRHRDQSGRRPNYLLQRATDDKVVTFCPGPEIIIFFHAQLNWAQTFNCS